MIKDVLRLMYENKHASVREIAESLNISEDALDIILERLERTGYAERFGTEAQCVGKSCWGCSLKSFCDKRGLVKLLRLTEKGRRAAQSE